MFVTAYDRYALKAFEAHALDYILKPFTDRRFHQVLALSFIPPGSNIPFARE